LIKQKQTQTKTTSLLGGVAEGKKPKNPGRKGGKTESRDNKGKRKKNRGWGTEIAR